MQIASYTMRYPLTILSLLYLASCSPSYHEKKADKEIYDILKRSEKHVFGKASNFSIDTKYSSLPPSAITANKLLKESQSKGKLTISVDQALDIAVNQSREFQSEKERLYLEALALSNTQNTFSSQVTGSVDTTVSADGDGDVPTSTAFSGRLNRSLLAGGAFSLSLANDLLRFFSGDPRTSATSIISANIVRPLLRGSGTDIASENLTQSSRNVVYAIRNFSTFQDEFQSDIVLAYLRLLQQQEEVKNEYNNYLSRQQNTKYLKARSVDRASPQEVSDSKQGELQAKTRWINAKSRYQSSLDNFKITLGIPAGTMLKLDSNELNKLRQAGLQSVNLSAKQAFNIALKNRLQLMNDVDRFDDTKRQVVVTADALKTQVDFVANASLRSRDSKFDHFNLNDLNTSVGVELNLPINRHTQRNSYRTSLIRFQAGIRSLSRSYDSLDNLIKLSLREINQFKQNYEIQQGAVKLAERRVVGNKLRLKAGTLIFRRLSESQDALISAQNAVTAALIDYQQSRLNLYNDLGILNTETKQFWLKANPTQQLR